MFPLLFSGAQKKEGKCLIVGFARLFFALLFCFANIFSVSSVVLSMSVEALPRTRIITKIFKQIEQL